MRILASNPDTIGDIVLRQPMYHALQDAGHELLLIVRSSVEPLVPYVAPGARTLILPSEPYRDDLDEQWAAYQQLFVTAREFAPDLLLIAPYQWTRFEERLSDELAGLTGLRRVAMSGHLYAGDPWAGQAPASRLKLDAIADVGIDLPEAEKNAALAALVLGRPIEQIDPKIEPTDAALAGASETLAHLGLVPDEYWIACVTGTVHVPIKGWAATAWGKVLREWSQRRERRFLFVGLPQEREAAANVRRLMGDRAEASPLWMPENATIDALIALTSLSRGYVGHDTGPMHIAAALGRPVLALFGGGHKLRFLPRATPSVSLTVGVACAGCGWTCTFETSHCVKDIPTIGVLAAADDLEEGRVIGRQARVLEPSAELRDRMIAEAAVRARNQLRDLADVSRRAEIAERAADPSHVGSRMQLALAESTELADRLRDREASIARLRADLDETASHAERLGADVADARAKAADGEALREQVERLTEQLKSLTTPIQRSPRRPLRQVLVDLFTGSRHYVPWRYPRPLPRILLATTVQTWDSAARETIESILAQDYPQLDFVVIDADPRSTEGAGLEEDGIMPADLRERVGKVGRVLRDAEASTFAGIARVFRAADAGVMGWVQSGDVLEAGALWRVGEAFRDHPRTSAIYFDDNVEDANGWRFAPPPRPRVEVYALLRSERLPAISTFFRRYEYGLLAQLQPEWGLAAGWDLTIRFARRYGLRRGSGEVVCRRVAGSLGFIALEEDRLGDVPNGESGRPNAASDEHDHPVDASAEAPSQVVLTAEGLTTIAATDAPVETPDESTAATSLPGAAGAEAAALRPEVAHVSRAQEIARLGSDFAAARRAFLAGFGTAGRLRCAVVRRAALVGFWLSRAARLRRFAFAPPPTDRGDPAVRQPPPFVAHHPIDPLTGHPPGRLLFTTPDTTTTAAPLYRVYYNEPGVAVTYPPLTADELGGIYARRASKSAVVSPPNPAGSPWAGYQGGRAWERALARVPSPRWWVGRPSYDDQSAQRGVRLLRRRAPAGDSNVNALVIGCFRGEMLEQLKALTAWRLSGAETNPHAAEAARAKGFVVWDSSAADACYAVPGDQSFDVIFLRAAEHIDDPVRVFRRLRQMLSPTGSLVIDVPNLDSKVAEIYGPTWSHWQAPYHRVLMGRRGLRQLAREADLRVARLRTWTDPYAVAASAQLNRVGLAGVVPEGASFPDEISSRGVRLTGWARLLWDWRGRGDSMYAVLEAK